MCKLNFEHIHGSSAEDLLAMKWNRRLRHAASGLTREFPGSARKKRQVGSGVSSTSRWLDLAAMYWYRNSSSFGTKNGMFQLLPWRNWSLAQFILTARQFVWISTRGVYFIINSSNILRDYATQRQFVSSFGTGIVHQNNKQTRFFRLANPL